MKLQAALPCIELAHEKTLSLGPVLFWPVTRFPAFLPSDQHDVFRRYLDASSFINTCISVDESIPPEKVEALILDALHLLYFNSSFRDIYYSSETTSFDYIRYIMPLSNELMTRAVETNNFPAHEKKLCLSCLETEVIEGLAKVLTAAYSDQGEVTQVSRRLISAIRYFNNCFFPRFINFTSKEPVFRRSLFDPEDCVFLAASFEALFDLPENNPVADFKKKLRPLLHLKYSNPLELFWKWADQFFAIRKKITKGETPLIPPFTLNRNFEVSCGTIGCRLVIYSIYYFLFSHAFIDAADSTPHFPPDFKWIHPENLLLFFWTESEIIHKIGLFTQTALSKGHNAEFQKELSFLVKLYLAYQKNYYQEPNDEIRFIRTPPDQIAQDLALLNEASKNPEIRLLLPEEFYQSLAQKNSSCQ